MKHILYHENNHMRPYAPQEDSYYHSVKNGVFVVADGVTHEPTDPVLYPMPSDAYEVARIICHEVVEYLEKKDFSEETIKKTYEAANKKVLSFNKKSSLYKNRENNGYTIGAATSSMVWIKDSKLLYGVLDDCFISIFSADLVDHPMLPSYVEQSAKYVDGNFDWGKIETRKYWRKDIRNHKIVVDGKEYGYGVIDGRKGFEQFLQLGEVQLKKGDLICVYTDGFIKLLQNLDFIKKLKNNDFTAETFELISNTAKEMGVQEEKTCYFIKYE